MEYKLVFTENTPKEQYDKLYTRPVGEVFEIRSDYETVMRKLSEYTPGGKIFRTFPINPGTSLFILYGANHSIIIENRSM